MLSLLCACAGLAPSCRRETTSILVVVDTDLSVPTETQELRVAVSPDVEGVSSQDEPFVLAGRFDQGCRDEGQRRCLPLSFVITERPGRPASSLVRVRVSAIVAGSSDRVLVDRRALIAFQPGRAVAFNMFLPKACGEGGSAFCARAQLVCTERGCEPERVANERLVPFTPGSERAVANGPDAALLFDADASADATLDGALIDVADASDITDAVSDRADAVADVRDASDASDALSCPDGGCRPSLELSVGYDHACVRKTETGEVLCWGDNEGAQLGRGFVTPPVDGGATGIAVPAPVIATDGGAPMRFEGIATGLSRTCGYTSDNEVYCWGFLAGNFYTEDNSMYVTRPSRVRGVTAPGGATITRIVASGPAYFLHWSNGEVHSFGQRTFAATGDGQMSAGPLRPPVTGAVAQLNNARVQPGYSDVGLAVSSSGAILGWGRVHSSRLQGLAATYMEGAHGVVGSPTMLPFGTGVRTAVASESVACALSTIGTVSCWGSNEGLLVDSAAADSMIFAEPRQRLAPPMGQQYVALSMVGATIAVLQTDGSLRCTGVRYNGLCPNDGLLSALSTIRVAPAAQFAVVGGGMDYMCALSSDDRVYCWGANRWAQCGAPASASVPVSTPNLVAIP